MISFITARFDADASNRNRRYSFFLSWDGEGSAILVGDNNPPSGIYLVPANLTVLSSGGNVRSVATVKTELKDKYIVVDDKQGVFFIPASDIELFKKL